LPSLTDKSDATLSFEIFLALSHIHFGLYKESKKLIGTRTMWNQSVPRVRFVENFYKFQRKRAL
jgi:hypothetical protein